MKIHGVELENFMLFDSLEADFSPNINIIIGENSTGKTALIKALYASARAFIDAQTAQLEIPFIFGYEMERLHNAEKTVPLIKEAEAGWGEFITPRLEGVFCHDSSDISRLVNRYQNASTSLSVDFNQNVNLSFQFGEGVNNFQTISVPRLPPRDSGNIVYIPTGEMISHTESFASLYEEYRIPFDETCYDLVRLLDRPQKRKLPEALQAVVNTLESTIGGKVVQRGRVFFLLMDNDEKIEMSLISDGYRKLATLLALLQSGALAEGSILFWDEPETNMNPRMIKSLVDALIAVAGAGVQVFVTTHDYFVQQYFGLAATYREKYEEDAGKLDFRFSSLYREIVEKDGGPDSRIAIESAAHLVDLKHNAVAEEYDVLGDREMGLFYGDDA